MYLLDNFIIFLVNLETYDVCMLNVLSWQSTTQLPLHWTTLEKKYLYCIPNTSSFLPLDWKKIFWQLIFILHSFNFLVQSDCEFLPLQTYLIICQGRKWIRILYFYILSILQSTLYLSFQFSHWIKVEF